MRMCLLLLQDFVEEAKDRYSPFVIGGKVVATMQRIDWMASFAKIFPPRGRQQQKKLKNLPEEEKSIAIRAKSKP